MGVTGSGNTTVGSMLAAELGWPFFDVDGFHSSTNVRIMPSDIPLTDDDRRPWLDRLNALISEQRARGESGLLACSALKDKYREFLASEDDVLIVYLRANPKLIEKRLASRRDHFMSRDLIVSQFRALEEPVTAITIPAERSPEEIVRLIRSRVGV